MGRGDTIAALSSGRPPAAIALLRLSGPDSFAIARAVAGKLPAPRRAALRTFRNGGGDPVDTGLLLVFPGPDSVTGEDVVEFHSHGGRAVIEALLAALVAAGARLAEPGEFTRRALENGRLDLTEAEGLADLLAAETELQRRAALARANGVVRRRVDDWRDRLLELSAAVEHAIDYAEEEGDAPVADLGRAAASLVAEMESWLAQPRLEPLRDGVRVVLSGPPNIGKSSLLNALCESDRAIVTPIAGTTRDSIEVPLAIDGVPFLFVDTAGLRDSADEVERLGIVRAHAELDRADLVIWLDPGEPAPDSRSFPVHAKADLGGESNGRLRVSALTGEGLPALRRALVDRARELLPGSEGQPLTRREADLVDEAAATLRRVSDDGDLVVLGDLLRRARQALDKLVGRSGIDDVLAVLFERFCVGK